MNLNRMFFLASNAFPLGVERRLDIPRVQSSDKLGTLLRFGLVPARKPHAYVCDLKTRG